MRTPRKRPSGRAVALCPTKHPTEPWAATARGEDGMTKLDYNVLYQTISRAIGAVIAHKVHMPVRDSQDLC
jgi:hypothetical protein